MSWLYNVSLNTIRYAQRMRPSRRARLMLLACSTLTPFLLWQH